MRALPLLLAAALAVAGCGTDDPLRDVRPLKPATESGDAHHFDVRRFATGFDRPTWVGAAPGGDALWVLEQAGRVIRLDGAERRVVLDLGDRVRVGSEQGLLGIAFHPEFARNGRLYL